MSKLQANATAKNLQNGNLLKNPARLHLAAREALRGFRRTQIPAGRGRRTLSGAAPLPAGGRARPFFVGRGAGAFPARRIARPRPGRHRRLPGRIHGPEAPSSAAPARIARGGRRGTPRRPGGRRGARIARARRGRGRPPRGDSRAGKALRGAQCASATFERAGRAPVPGSRGDSLPGRGGNPSLSCAAASGSRSRTASRPKTDSPPAGRREPIPSPRAPDPRSTGSPGSSGGTRSGSSLSAEPRRG